jgi:hypothetical protein
VEVRRVKKSIELAQQNVHEARIRLELFRSFVQGSRLSEEPTTAPEVECLLATIEECLRLQENYWECLLKEEDHRSRITAD